MIPDDVRRPTIVLDGGDEGAAGERRCYDVAGVRLVTDFQIPELAPLAASIPIADPFPMPPPAAEPGWRRARLFDDTAFIGGRASRLAAYRVDAGTEISLDGAATFVVERGGRLIRRLSAPTPRDRELLLGPVIAVALAWHDRFLLHASTVIATGEAVCFLGESGAGKSTIAAALDGRDAMVRAGDDMGAFRAAARLQFSPRFPQPKAPALAAAGDDNIPVNALVMLRPAGPDADLAVGELLPRQLFDGVVGATVAARLFDHELAARHLDFAARASTSVKGLALDYPHRPGAVDELAGYLAGDLGRAD